MLSKNKIKFIQSLHDKKNRSEEWLFLVEWEKSIAELLNSDFEIIELYISESFENKYKDFLGDSNYYIATETDLTKASTLKTNTFWIAIVKKKQNIDLNIWENEYVLMLDDIRDPGNLWTIIRIADWYWIKKIICSNNTVEAYNPKVIISTMWSFTRVNLFYTDLKDYLSKIDKTVYWTFLNWENVHQTKFEKSWIIIIWSESFWISREVENLVTNKITIPSFWNTESLNAWVATAIILDNLRR